MRFLTFLIVVALFYFFYVRPRCSVPDRSSPPRSAIAAVGPAASSPGAHPAQPASPPAESSALKRPFDRANAAIDAVKKRAAE